MDSTVETTPEDDNEESKSGARKHEEESRLMGNERMTTKEKVKKLKADLERKMRLMRGEEVEQTDEKGEVKVNDPDEI